MTQQAAGAGADHVAHSWAGTSLDLTTEEGRAFLQERLALLGKIGFLLSGLFFVLLLLAWPWLFAPRNDQQPGDFTLPTVRQGLFLAQWLVCRRGRRSLPVLLAMDAGLPLLVSLDTAAQVIVTPGRIPGQEWAILLTLTNMLGARAVFVPSPPRRTLAIGLVASIPVAVASIVYQTTAGAAPGSGAIAAISALVWCLCAIALTTLASAVIYGLREKVREVQRLGQYTLEEKLGEGGMGIVYRARHAMLRRPTAVKLLPAEKAGEQSIRRFEREVQHTAQLSHPNTVAIYDYGRTADGVFYYAMEYLDGITLQSLVRQFGPQPPARVVHILQQVAGALAEAHEVGLVHRDVKPANIILCERGGVADVAKVVDFGLVRDLAGTKDASATDLEMIAGTPLYLAPEAITHPGQLDARGDLYALGAVAYFLLTGSHVFTGANVLEICGHHLHTRPEVPSERLGSPLPPTLEALVMACLEKDPARRPTSAREMADRLRACEDTGSWSDRDGRDWWRRNRDLVRSAGSDPRPALSGPTPTLEVSLDPDASLGPRTAIGKRTGPGSAAVFFAVWLGSGLATPVGAGTPAAHTPGAAGSGPQARASQVDPYVPRPRVLVLTDIANEPDDQMSLVRFLVYANEYEVEGIVATTSTWMKDRVRPDVIHTVLDAYEQVQPNLLKHAPGFPTAAALREVVAAGQPGYGLAAVGPGKVSPGAERIVRAALRDDPRPLWVSVWGGANTLAQALLQARATRSPRELEALVAKLRVYSISDQDDAGAWIRREFPALHYVVMPSTPDGEEYALATWTGISGDRFYRNAPGADFTTFTDDWVNANVRSKGPLGKHYPYPCCIHEGDTPSFLGLIDNGLGSAMSPAYGGWGGRYVWRQPRGETRALFTQGGDSYPGRDSSRDTVTGSDGKAYTSDQATIWRWRRAFQHDFAARLDWTVKEPDQANHNPLLVLNGRAGKAPIVLDAEVGVPVTLDAMGTRDPDGDAFSLAWFFYAEAGSGIPGQPVFAPRPRRPAGEGGAGAGGPGGGAAVGGATGEGGIPSAPAGGPREAPARVVVDNPNGWRAIVVPKVAGIAHIVLAVEDAGAPSLTAYRRVIFNIKPAPEGGATATPPLPVDLTAEQDHRRLLDLLGIESIRRGADPRNPQAPNAVNYDEAKANPHPALPDPLLLKDGRRVTSAARWWEERRPEIVQDFDRELYGRQPEATPPVSWSLTSDKKEVVGGRPVRTRRLVGRVDNSSYAPVAVDIDLSLTTPTEATGPVPVMLELGFNFDRGAGRPPAPPGAAPEGPTWQEQVIAKGWGYAILHPTSVQADNGAGLTRGIIGLVNRGQPRAPEDWGALRAWAWGASRALDYFETDAAVDARQVGVEGLSRYGKAALVAMAYDPRFAIAFVASSGAGGAKLHRRNYGELVENLAGAGQYHWMAGNFIRYAGPLAAQDLPVDAHELIALCAPRPVFISVGSFEVEGGWVDARGMFLAAAAVGPVYRLLGRRGLGTDEFPPIETALVNGDVAFRQHRGGHTAGPNWPTFLEFAGRYLRPCCPAP